MEEGADMSAAHKTCVSAGDGSCLQTDVAVVGAGPAGIAVALELARAGHRVLLLESGGDSYDPEVQRLGDALGGDPLHVAMSLATRRQIGGASNLWGGRCVPFDPVDFEPREVAYDAGWPIGYEEIAQYFQRACDWCVCGEAVFEARHVPDLAGRSLVPGFPDGDVLASSLERWSLPTNFGRVYRSDLKQTPGLRLMTGLTCTEVVCESMEPRVRHLRAQSLAGDEVTITASRYVLACGGLEITRLLFASDRHHPGGLGNHSGHLGRHYMAHVESRIARVHFATPPEDTIYGHERDGEGVYVRRRFTFAREFLLKQRLPNAAIWLVNPPISDSGHGSGILSFVYLMLVSPIGRFFVAEGIRQAHIESSESVSVRAHLRNVACNLGPAIRFALEFGYKRFVKRGRKVPGFFVPSAVNTYSLLYHGEHLPHGESNVAPSSERDALGVLRLQTHLWFSDEDVQGVLRAHKHLDAYLRAYGLGYLEYLHEDLEAAVREQLFGGYHQAGTTRMSARPEDGVVDEHLAVHGFEDLFVASSSTFVTSGQANSTFMIVAFALRLADQLHEQLVVSREDELNAGADIA
jgi:choline dehydrogenase-like flavoprotein